jgi:uncharacterized membrane protein YecN with MAPEG domain
MEIIVPKEYPLVLTAIALICTLCFCTQFVVGFERKKTFGKEFMAQFEEEHEKAFPGTKPDALGYPDCGDGRYSAKLDYKTWINFNNKVRVAQNFYELLPLIVVFLSLGGLVIPKITACVGFLYFVARIVYSVMYIKCGANARKLGGITGGLPVNVVGLIAFGELIRNHVF